MACVRRTRALRASPSRRTCWQRLLVWTLFADVARRVRWRAAYAARAIAPVDPSFLAALVERLDGRDPGPYRDESLVFYEMSARLWLLLTLARIGADDRDALDRQLA